MAPERLRDYIERFLADRRAPRHHRRRLRARLGRLPARAAGGQPEDRRRACAQFEAIANDVADLVLEFGGALSGEHGDGLVRSAVQARRCSARRSTRRSATVKRTFDPHGIFNPGKIVDTPPHHRATCASAPAIARPSRPTFFDFGADGGLGGAVEMCSGVGACRKTLEGTMCPSYMATRDEAALDARPRQRAAAGDERASSASRASTTRACTRRSTCASSAAPARPSARSASTWRASRASSSPTTGSATARRCSARALGHVRTRWRAGAAGSRRSSNAIAGSARRAGAERGAARRRSPAHAAARGRARTLSRRLRAARRRASPVRAVLFADTFTDYYDPEIGVAALEVLDRGRHRRAAGAARLLRPAADLAGPARRGARAGAAQRRRAARRRGARRGRSCSVEPSCLSAIREDVPALLRGEARERARDGGRAERAVRGVPRSASCAAGRAAAAAARRPADGRCCTGTATRESMGLAGAGRARCCRRIPGATVDRPRRRLLRHGRLVRLRARALRRVARDRRAQAVAGRARARRRAPCSWRPARRAGTRWPISPASTRVHPAVLLRSLAGGRRMNLAVDLARRPGRSPWSSAGHAS